MAKEKLSYVSVRFDYRQRNYLNHKENFTQKVSPKKITLKRNVEYKQIKTSTKHTNSSKLFSVAIGVHENIGQLNTK